MSSIDIFKKKLEQAKLPDAPDCIAYDDISHSITVLLWSGGYQPQDPISCYHAHGSGKYLYISALNETRREFFLSYTITCINNTLILKPVDQFIYSGELYLRPHYPKKNKIVPIHDFALECARPNGFRQEILKLEFQPKIKNSDLSKLRNTSITLEIDYGQTPHPDNAERENMDTKKPDPKKVFVVYGRDHEARDAIYDILEKLDLKPIDWDRALSLVNHSNPYIGEVIDKAMEEAQAIIVLLTGDDEARLQEKFIASDDPESERNLMPQPRPNVIFEAGLALGKFPERTIFISFISLGKLRLSDIGGRYISSWNNDSKTRHSLVETLKRLGCQPDTSSTRFLDAGKLSRFET